MISFKSTSNNRDACVLRIPLFRSECLEGYSNETFLS